MTFKQPQNISVSYEYISRIAVGQDAPPFIPSGDDVGYDL